MKPRSKTLVIPADSARYWVVDLEGDKGEHAFKFPNYAIAYKVCNLFGEDWGGGMAGNMIDAGVVIGACWSHDGLVLEVPRLSVRIKAEEAEAYAMAVIEELQDAGYTKHEVSHLWSVCMEHIKAWVIDASEAVEESADFTEARQVA